ncbi:DUF423 domain-containing protein [Flavicella sp.]|uniref:DUF423 domain-containing protein n=1 Tax=Flavicella sp. TaxID=2957742 RepID=UPI00260EC345|nr:DUF423 domain-containing protein [Flavicella sp.]MDG1804514.1 DUF423 domain-containing protein [Flavicella sp.]
MRKTFLIITAILGVLTIILGAFGAHALKEVLSSDSLKSFETAVRYQMYHVLVLLFVNTTQILTEKTKNNLSYTLLIGVLLFSGSIYAITIGGIPAKSIWFVTPLGGLFLIVSWLILLFGFIKSKTV